MRITTAPLPHVDLDTLPTRPAIVSVGVWDPLLPPHTELLFQQTAHARRRGFSSMVVVIDPPPPTLLHGPRAWPQYADLATRERLLHAHGIDAVMRMSFTRESLEASPADFFRLVSQRVSLAELWLGAYQAIGTGPESSQEDVDRLASLHQVTICRLPETEVSLLGNDVRRLLADGCVATARDIVGRPPTVRRGPTSTVSLAWAPGVYQARPADTPAADPFVVLVTEDSNGERAFAWPDPGPDCLAFLSGPGDQSRPAPRKGGDVH